MMHDPINISDPRSLAGAVFSTFFARFGWYLAEDLSLVMLYLIWVSCKSAQWPAGWL